jgi:hypothetical protein
MSLGSFIIYMTFIFIWKVDDDAKSQGGKGGAAGEGRNLIACVALTGCFADL